MDQNQVQARVKVCLFIPSRDFRVVTQMAIALLLIEFPVSDSNDTTVVVGTGEGQVNEII